MFKCIFVKRKLYGYLTEDLSERDSIALKKHLDVCLPCQKRLRKIKDLLWLVENKNIPKPSEDFWHNFRTELDEKLNTKLLGDIEVMRGYKLKPALALSLVSVVILVLGVYLYSKFLFTDKSNLTLINEMAILEEVDPGGIALNNDEASYIDEFELFYQFDQSLT